MRKKLIIFASCLATIAWAATKADFSGTYAAQQKKSDKTMTASLRVVQTEAAVEVTRIYGDKSFTNTFPLDGSEGNYTTETGAPGKCSAHLKGDTLVLEALVASRPSPNAPSVRFDTIEKWRLSADTNTLTVETEIKSPDMPPDIVTSALPNQTKKYQRVGAQ
jgi:hypothetical protein